VAGAVDHLVAGAVDHLAAFPDVAGGVDVDVAVADLACRQEVPLEADHPEAEGSLAEAPEAGQGSDRLVVDRG